MYGLTNRYIYNLLSKFSLSFKGVFSCDNIPYLTEYNVSIICNFSKANTKGTHYVAIYIFKDKIIYFDPLGLKCVVNSICNYLRIYNKTIIESNFMIQHPLSFHCGFFCIGFIFAMDKNISLQLYHNLFTTVNLIDNDRNVCSFIIKFIENV